MFLRVAAHHYWQGNSYILGIKAEHPSVGSWPAVQMDAYRRLVAVLAAHYCMGHDRVLGHKEVAAPVAATPTRTST